MKVQPKGTTPVVKRGRHPYTDAEIEKALRLLRKTTEEIVLRGIRVPQHDETAKSRYRARINSISRRLNKPVSIYWSDGATSSPVLSKANR